MKTGNSFFLLMVILFATESLFAIEISTNRNPVGLEHNILFNSASHYNVTQSGSVQLSIPALFDGKFEPSYSATAPSESDPYILEITGIPGHHTQAGAWIGWSTRYWPATRFKIEGFDVYYGNNWVTLADYENMDYSGKDYIQACSPGSYTKLKFTFYKASGRDGRLGISELFFIHPEATQPYGTLYSPNAWQKTGSNLYYTGGKVGIGTSLPQSELSVRGAITTQEIIVTDAGWSDFVFDDDYALPSLDEVESFIKEKNHLPDIPSETEIKKNGLSIADMIARQMQKIEELTIYLIELKKENQTLQREMEELKLSMAKNKMPLLRVHPKPANGPPLN